MGGMWRQRERQESSKEDSNWWCHLLKWGNIRTGGDLEICTDMLSWRCLLDIQTNADETAKCGSLEFEGDTGAKEKTFKVISIHDINYELNEIPWQV